MGRRSSISQLPKDIQDTIGRLFEHGVTLDAMRAKLAELLPQDQVPSRSALHRHIQGLDEIAKEIQRTKAMAEALVRSTADEPESKVAQLNIQLAHAVLLKTMTNEGGVVSLDPEETMFVASAVQKLASAAKTDNELRGAIRREIAAEMAKKLDDEVKSGRGLTAEQAARLKADFLGMKV